MTTVFILAILNFLLLALIIALIGFDFKIKDKHILIVVLIISFFGTFNLLLKQSDKLDEQIQKERLLDHLENLLK